MTDMYTLAGDAGGGPPRRSDTPAPPQIVINNIPPRQPWLGRTFFKFLLFASILANLVFFGMYSQHFSKSTANEVFKEGEPFATDKIALIRVSNMITRDSVAAPRKELKTAADDDGVKAVVLLVDSPGGTISGSDELYHAIVEFKEKSKKPLVVSMQGIATSGAYYISMPADKIFADRSCITGSIGVIASLIEVEKLLKNWGITPEVIKSGKMKDSGSPFRAMNEDDRKYWQRMIDQMYRQFLDVVLTHRKDKIVGGETRLKELADGRTYMASEAKEFGLIDEVGYQDDAIAAAKKLANLGDKVRIVGYSRSMADFLGLLSGESSGSTKPAFDVNQLLELRTPRMYLLPTVPPLVGL